MSRREGRNGKKKAAFKEEFPRQEKARATKLLLYSSLLSCLLSPYQGSVAVYLTIVHSSLLHYQLYPKWQMQQFITTMILLALTWQSFSTFS